MQSIITLICQNTFLRHLMLIANKLNVWCSKFFSFTKYVYIWQQKINKLLQHTINFCHHMFLWMWTQKYLSEQMGVSQAYMVKSVSCDCVGSLEDFLLHEESPAQESWRGTGIGYIVNVFVCRGKSAMTGCPPQSKVTQTVPSLSCSVQAASGAVSALQGHSVQSVRVISTSPALIHKRW